MPEPVLPAPDAGIVYAAGPGVSRHWLESMRRDGLLVAVGPDHYLPVDAATWPAARCRALGAALPAGCVVGAASAVWAMGGPCSAPESPGDPVLVSVIARQHSMARGRPWLRVHRAVLDDVDVQYLDGTPITGDARTLADLALLGESADDPALAWLVRHRGVTVADAVRALKRRGRTPGLRRAVAVLRLLNAGVDDPLTQHDQSE